MLRLPSFSGVFETVFQGLRFLACLLPPRFFLGFCASLGRFIGLFFHRERRIGIAQIKLAQKHVRELSTATRSKLPPGAVALVDANPEQLISDVFAHVGRSFGEALIVRRMTKPAAGGDPTTRPPALHYVSSTGLEEVYRLREERGSLFAFSGHIGNFELLAAFHVRSHIPLSVVARLPNFSSLERTVSSIRKDYGIEMIWRDDPSTGRKFMQAIKTKRVIAALIDQDTGLENGFSPFFGVDAAIPIAPIKLAIRQKLPVFTSFIVRTGPLSHHVETRQIDYQADDPEAATHIMEVYSNRLQELVCRYPEQWLWWHRRWRRRPNVDYVKNPPLLPSTNRYLNWLEEQIHS